MIPRERKYLFHYLDVIDQDSSEQMGYLGDISKNGIMLITKNSLPANKNFNIRIITKGEHNLSGEEINLRIQTRWTKPNLNPKIYCTGCEILSISDEDKEKLDQVEEFLCFDSNVTITRVGNEND